MMKSESYWREATEDFIRFRKGELTEKELMERYPEFHMKAGWLWLYTMTCLFAQQY